MSEIVLYGLKTCDTCRKALHELRAAGLEPEFRDVRENGVGEDLLNQLVFEFGPEAVVNRRSTTWRSLDDAARSAAMSPEGAAAILTGHPTLMKRPLVLKDGRAFIGWTSANRAAIL